jgi:hypothetical protein
MLVSTLCVGMNAVVMCAAGARSLSAAAASSCTHDRRSSAEPVDSVCVTLTPSLSFIVTRKVQSTGLKAPSSSFAMRTISISSRGSEVCVPSAPEISRVSCVSSAVFGPRCCLRRHRAVATLSPARSAASGVLHPPPPQPVQRLPYLHRCGAKRVRCRREREDQVVSQRRHLPLEPRGRHPAHIYIYAHAFRGRSTS